MRVAVLGLGEAGSIYSADLAAIGASVTGTDPRVSTRPPGVVLAPDIAASVADADLVLSLVGAKEATAVLVEALAAMRPTAVYADMNTADPEHKRRLAAVAAERGIPFTDVAILAPVPRERIRTPLLLSGAGAEDLLPVVTGMGIPASVVGVEAGIAAGHKLLRSIFMKGLAALVLESVTAAEQFGAQDWVRAQIASELGESGDALVQHLLAGTERHAVRRETEMRDVRAFLESLGAEHPMTDGTIAWLHAVADRVPPPPSVG